MTARMGLVIGVWFVMPVRVAALHRLLVQGAIPVLGEAFGGTCGTCVIALRLGFGRPRLVRVA